MNWSRFLKKALICDLTSDITAFRLLDKEGRYGSCGVEMPFSVTQPALRLGKKEDSIKD